MERLLAVLATSNHAGDPDTWPEAFAYGFIAFAIAAVVIAWFVWGKDAYTREGASRHNRRTGHEPTWSNLTTTRTTQPKSESDD